MRLSGSYFYHVCSSCLKYKHFVERKNIMNKFKIQKSFLDNYSWIEVHKGVILCFLFKPLLLGGRENPVALGENNKPNFDRAFLDTEAVSLKSLFRVHRSSASLCTLKSDFPQMHWLARKTLSKFPFFGVAFGGFMVLQGEDLRSDLKFQHGFWATQKFFILISVGQNSYLDQIKRFPAFQIDIANFVVSTWSC